jgi:PIN domain nuclease of toxin-antitoxin system
MRVLLDTNVAIWLVDAPQTLRTELVGELVSDETSLVVSVVVPWEVWPSSGVPVASVSLTIRGPGRPG